MKLIERPFTLIEEDQQSRRANPVVRVERMFEQITEKLPGAPQFILCVLPERKNSDIYGKRSSFFKRFPFFVIVWIYVSLNCPGPWKKKSLSDFGIATQCISPSKINDQYLTNVLLKINSKVSLETTCLQNCLQNLYIVVFSFRYDIAVFVFIPSLEE